MKTQILLNDNNEKKTEPNVEKRTLSKLRNLQTMIPKVFSALIAIIPALALATETPKETVKEQRDFSEGPSWKASSIYWEEPSGPPNPTMRDKIQEFAQQQNEMEANRKIGSILTEENLQRISEEMNKMGDVATFKDYENLQKVFMEIYDTSDKVEMYEQLRQEIDISLRKPDVSALEDQIIDQLDRLPGPPPPDGPDFDPSTFQTTHHGTKKAAEEKKVEKNSNPIDEILDGIEEAGNPISSKSTEEILNKVEEEKNGISQKPVEEILKNVESQVLAQNTENIQETLQNEVNSEIVENSLTIRKILKNIEEERNHNNLNERTSNLEDGIEHILGEVEKNRDNYLKNMTSRERMEAWRETHGSPASPIIPSNFNPDSIPESKFDITNKKSVFPKDVWNEIEKYLESPSKPKLGNRAMNNIGM